MFPPARLAAHGYARSSASHRASLLLLSPPRIATAGIATNPTPTSGATSSGPPPPPPIRKPNRDGFKVSRPQHHRPDAAGPPRTQREQAGLERSNIGPSSPSRYWPKFQIPSDAKQLDCSFDALTRGPVTVAWLPNFLFVQDKAKDEGRRALKPLTIRDSCDCHRCRDPVSGQKTFSSTEIPLTTKIADVKPTEQGLVLTWTTDIPRFIQDAPDATPHETLLPWSSVEIALRRGVAEDPPLPRKRNLMRYTGAVYWDAASLDSHVRTIDYAAFINDDKPRWDAVIDLLRLGIVFLSNVPKHPDAVLDIVARIANIRETFYGRTFDVRAKPAADNVAYTAAALAPHQDLAYLDPQPLIQVLHAMDNSCEGGESLFSDGERVGRLLTPFIRQSPRMAPLADHHIPYHYTKNGHRYFASRHVVEMTEFGYANICWSPPFQGQALCPTRDLRPWIPAARLFEAMVGDRRAVYRRKLAEGECVLFDNQRVLHGRTAFDPAAGGERWLRGAYIAPEDFLSKASHMPLDQATAIRGPRVWTPAAAQSALRESAWHKDALKRVRKIDPEFRQLEEEEGAARRPRQSPIVQPIFKREMDTDE